jgi:hypothetical protein
MRARAISSPPSTPALPFDRAPAHGALVFLRGRDADARLQRLTAVRRAARPVLGALALELVARRLYEPLGYRNLGDYGRERIGVGARALREWARVWRQLQSLPRLRAAVLEGELSWGAARLVVGLAEPSTEAACLRSVRGRTLRAVEEIVRVFKAANTGSSGHGSRDLGERRSLRLRCTPKGQSLWLAALELARRVAGEELPTWRCAELIAAEAASALGAPDAPARQAAPLSPCSRAEVSASSALRCEAFGGLSWRACGASLPDELLGLAADAPQCAAREIDRRLRLAIAFLQRVDLESGRILRQMLDRRLFSEIGFSGLSEYARERLDASPRTARRLIALARVAHRSAAVASAFRAGRVHALQVRVLGRAADAAAWVARAQALTLRGLEEALEPDGISFVAPAAVASFFLGMLQRAGSLERMLGHAIVTWAEQGKRFRDYADFTRDGYRCTVPGCTARRNLQSHHVRFRSRGGPDEPWNRTTLCAFHHLRGVHLGRIGIEGRAPGSLLYELGTGERFRSDQRRYTLAEGVGGALAGAVGAFDRGCCC